MPVVRVEQEPRPGDVNAVLERAARVRSTAIHSLSFSVDGEVVGLMKVGGHQLRWPLPSNVPLLTATVFGALVRLKPSPA